MLLCVGAGFLFIGLEAGDGWVPRVVGSGLLMLGTTLVSLRRGTVIDTTGRKVMRRLGWWFRPRDEEYSFSSFSCVAVARTPGTTPVLAVQLVGPPHVFLPVGGQGRKKQALRRAKEVAELLGLELSRELNQVRSLELY